MLEECRLTESFEVRCKSHCLICNGGQGRDKLLIIFSFPLLDHDNDRTIKRQAFEFTAAFSQPKEPNPQRNIGIIKGVEEVQGKNGLTFGRDVRQRIEEAVACGSPCCVEVPHNFFDRGGSFSDPVRQRKRWQPFISREDKKRSVQNQAGDQVGLALIRLILGEEESKSTFFCNINHEFDYVIHSHRIACACKKKNSLWKA